MGKSIVTFLLVIVLLILGAGLYLGHKGINKLEISYSDSLGKQTSVTKKLQEDNNRLDADLKKALTDKAAVEADLKKQTDLVSTLLKQAQDAMIMEGQVKEINEQMKKTVESCQIRPKAVKRAVVAKKYTPPAPVKVEERIVIREVPAKTQTIVINKIYIKQGNNKPKLIKQDQKLLPEAYPNDLLK